MEAQDPLSQLADIHLPQTVGFWPLAPGWWILIALFLAVLAFSLYRLYASLMQRKRRQAALNELDRAYQRLQELTDQSQFNQAGLDFLYAINSILKRVALNTDQLNKALIPELSGSAWLRYLDASLQKPAFSQGSGKVLAEGQYQPEFRADPEALLELARQWVTESYQNRKQRNRSKVEPVATDAKTDNKVVA